MKVDMLFSLVLDIIFARRVTMLGSIVGWRK